MALFRSCDVAACHVRGGVRASEKNFPRPTNFLPRYIFIGPRVTLARRIAIVISRCLSMALFISRWYSEWCAVCAVWQVERKSWSFAVIVDDSIVYAILQ